jgi:hypothetical protein
MFPEEDSQPDVQYDERTKREKEKDDLITALQEVLNGGQSVENETSLLSIVQKQRKLLLDIATQTFISKPNNPKLLDSINTLLGHMEKSVRDDRKERLRDRELEDNKANFSVFANALIEITAGRITMPTFGEISLDPLGDEERRFFETDNPDEEIKPDEMVGRRQVLDSKKIQESFDISDEPDLNLTDEPEDDDSEFDPES